MSKLTKNKKLALEKIEDGRVYTIEEAAQLVKEITFTKFDASVDIDVRLGVDPRKANQMVRGVVTLPHGTGKDIRVLVLCTPDKVEEAKAAGADYVGLDEYIEKTIPFKTGVQNLMQYTENVNTESTEDIPLEGLHALIAEDNELNLEIAKLMLEEKGICVECAADGKEAVAKFEESEPGYYDVIFMDIMMPYMNGWDATRKIRTLQRPDADKIPIIAMSANAFAEDIINSHISGMNWHLTKPIDADKLMTALKECIRKNNIR